MTAMLVFFHLSFRLTANNFIHHKQYLESGVLLKHDTSRPRILSRTNELRRPIVSWNKWGYTCVHLPAKDLRICIDIHPNPGPCSEKYSNAQEGNTRYHYKLNTQHAAVQLPIVYNSSQLPASWITGYCRLNSTLLSTTASFNILRYQGSKVGRSIQGSKMAENRRIQVRISSRYSTKLHHQILHNLHNSNVTNSLRTSANNRNPSNLITIHPDKQEPPKRMITNNVNPNNGLTGLCKQKMLLTTLNARSVRNKTVDIFYSICESKADLIAITETWLTKNDSAVKVELCPVGYKIVDHPRTGRTGGGTALIFRDTLNVKKVDGGQKDSFEFSEWIVTSSSHNVRIVIVYRPPYSKDHKVSTSVFFDEFSANHRRF